MQLSTWVVGVALGAVVLSGCVEDPATGSAAPGTETNGLATPDSWAPIKALLADVPCEADVVNDATSGNLLELARATSEAGGVGEVDIRGDLALVANFGTGGFSTVDISDPLNPRVLGYFSEAGSSDVKFSPDNMTAIAGGGQRITLVDIRDPENPTLSGEWQFPTGGVAIQNAHMLFSSRIADQDWVFVAPNDNTGVFILRLDGPPEARTLTMVSQTLPVEGGPLGPHDMFAQYDEDEARWLLYSSDGFHGWIVFDVSDPTNPLPYGGFVNPEPGYTHTIQAAKIGDRRIVATISEVGVNILKVYDATVLQAPVLLGVWQWEVGAGSTDPQHDFNIVDGKLYLAHYGRGIYVFDLTVLGPAPVAGTLDLMPVAHFAASGQGGFGDFWDIVLKDGILYGGHMTDGLYVIGYGCNEPGDATLTSTG